MISVIMGVYNSKRYLRESIESILNQSFSKFEFIIIDDGSNDGSSKILRKYSKKEPKIKIIENKKNIGLTASLNKGLKAAKYDIIARMDADDISKKDRLQKQYNFLKANEDISVLGTSAIDINKKGEIINHRKVPLSYDEIKKTVRFVNPIIHSSVMFRKNDILKIGGYNENYRKVQDYELWFRCIANNIKLNNLKEELILYRRDNKYYKRKSLYYRWTDFKIRFECYRLLNIPFYKWYTLFIPIILGFSPKFLLNFLYKYKDFFDPRNK